MICKNRTLIGLKARTQTFFHRRQNSKNRTFQSYQGSIFTGIVSKSLGNAKLFQSYQGSIFTRRNYQSLRVLNLLSILSRFYFYPRTIKQEKRRMTTFNPIKVLFLPGITSVFVSTYNTFNPIKVLFLRSSTDTNQQSLFPFNPIKVLFLPVYVPELLNE